MYITKYIDNLELLREEAKEIANDYPEILKYFIVKGYDPDIERLLEGYAFINTKIQNKIESEYPEFIYGLIQALWPSYLKITPAASILNISFKKNYSSKKVLHRNTYVSSKTKEKNCHFKTCNKIYYNPFEIINTRHVYDNKNNKIIINLDVNEVNKLETKHLDFYINGNAYQKDDLYKYIYSDVNQVKFTIFDIEGNILKVQTRTDAIQDIGFEHHERLFPGSMSTNESFRLMHEYLIYRNKFYFFRIKLNACMNVENVKKVSIELIGYESSYELKNLPKNVFSINCTPIVNIFNDTGKTIIDNNNKNAYKLESENENNEIYSVKSVAVREDNENIIEYPLFENFEHGRSNKNRFYYVRFKFHEHIRKQITYIHINSPFKTKKIITCEVESSNSNIPEKLRVGDVCFHHDLTPSDIIFENIEKFSQYTTPVYSLEENRLIDNLAMSFCSISDLENLKKMLISIFINPYEKSEGRANLEMCMRSLTSIKTKQKNFIKQGSVIRGYKVVVTSDDSKIVNKNALYLFSKTLFYFFLNYMSINTGYEMHFMTLTGNHYKWNKN